MCPRISTSSSRAVFLLVSLSHFDDTYIIHDVAVMNIYLVTLYIRKKSERKREKEREETNEGVLVCQLKIGGECMKIRYSDSLSRE